METNRSTVKVQRATTIPAAASDSTTAFEQNRVAHPFLYTPRCALPIFGPKLTYQSDQPGVVLLLHGFNLF